MNAHTYQAEVRVAVLLVARRGDVDTRARQLADTLDHVPAPAFRVVSCRVMAWHGERESLAECVKAMGSQGSRQRLLTDDAPDTRGREEQPRGGLHRPRRQVRD